MVKRKKQIKQITVKDIPHGRLLIYLLLVIAAVFLVSKLDITGKAVADVQITQTINAGEVINIDIDTNKKDVEPEIDIYKHFESGKSIRYCQNCWSICRESECNGKFQLIKHIPDDWTTGKYSVRVYDEGNEAKYTEVFFNVEGIYPGTDDVKETKVHR